MSFFRGSIEYRSAPLYSLSPHAPPIFGLIVDMTYSMSVMMCQLHSRPKDFWTIVPPKMTHLHRFFAQDHVTFKPLDLQ